MTAELTARAPCRPLTATRPRPERVNDADAIAKVAKLLRTPLMPWQLETLQVATERVDGPGSPFAYPTVVLGVARRGGKTAMLSAYLVKRALTEPDFLGRYMGARGFDGAAWWRELRDNIERSPLSPAFGSRARTGGEALIALATHAEVEVLAPNRRAGHGRRTTCAVTDEAWALDSEIGRELEVGLSPGFATEPLAQWWITSAAGDPRSTWWNAWCDRGRRAAEEDRGEGLAYFEYGDVTGPYDSEETWFRAHPALGHTIRPAYLRGELERLQPEDFARSYLNRSVTNIDRSIPAFTWDRALTAERLPDGPPAWGISLSPDRRDAVIVAAGAGSASIVEVVEHRSGVGWVPARMAELVRAHGSLGVAVDALEVAPVHDDLTAAGVATTSLKPSDRAAACGAFLGGLETGRVLHRGQPSLDAAAASAVKRLVADGSGFTWSRRASAGDITSLQAATWACWQLAHKVPPAPRSRVY